MDKITVADLEVFYRIGVTAEERREPQRLHLTIEMDTDLTRAAQSDDLRHTIDYGEVAQRLLAFGVGKEWNLIEALASEVAQFILENFSPREVVVEVKKFIIPQARYVSVRLKRSRDIPGSSGQNTSIRV